MELRIILKIAACTFTMLAISQQGFLQPLTPSSLGAAGMRTGIRGIESLWHIPDHTLWESKSAVSLVSAMPYTISGLHTGGVAYAHRLRKMETIGIRLHSMVFDQFSQTKAELLYSRSLSTSSTLGLSTGVKMLRIGSERELTGAYSLTFMHWISENTLIGLLVVDPLPIGPIAITHGAFHIGITWNASAQFQLRAELNKPAIHRISTRWAFVYKPLSQFGVLFGFATQPVTVHFGSQLAIGKLFDVTLGIRYHPSLGITPGLGFTYPPANNASFTGISNRY